MISLLSISIEVVSEVEVVVVVEAVTLFDFFNGMNFVNESTSITLPVTFAGSDAINATGVVGVIDDVLNNDDFLICDSNRIQG